MKIQARGDKSLKWILGGPRTCNPQPPASPDPCRYHRVSQQMVTSLGQEKEKGKGSRLQTGATEAQSPPFGHPAESDCQGPQGFAVGTEVWECLGLEIVSE